MYHHSLNSSISKFLWISFNRTVQHENQNLFRRCSEIFAVQKVNSICLEFSWRNAFLFWNPVMSQCFKMRLPIATCTAWIKNHKVKTLPNITRSVLWGAQQWARERHHANFLHTFKCRLRLKRHEIGSSQYILWQEKRATFTDLVIRLGFQSLWSWSVLGRNPSEQCLLQ